MTDPYEPFILKYLQSAYKINFDPGDTETLEGKQDAVRYCLVNGLMPITKESLSLVGGGSVYIEAERLPETVTSSLRFIEESSASWEYVEDTETEEIEELESHLSGVRIKDGKIVALIKSTKQKEIVWAEYTRDLDEAMEFP